jgi:dolichyl-phosphate beta-glucosyltransferase
MSSDEAPYAQIVVPCYNEESRLDVPAFDAFLAASPKVGFVFVNDGSKDGTLTVLRKFAAAWPGRVQVIDQQPNQGKAEAVRVGMLHALGSGAAYAGYFDADLATPLNALGEFITALDDERDLDIVIGSRVALLGRHIDRNPARHYLGRVFATAASLVLALPIYDTQCGAKLMRASAQMRELFALPFGSRWIFDVELLARYLTSFGSRRGLYELPLRRWSDIGDSRVKSRDFVRAGAEIAAIYRDYGIRRDFDTLLRVLSAPFLRYVGAGGLGTLLHYGVLALLVQGFAASPAQATVVGALFGALANYVLNYHLTFASKAPHRRTLPRFLTVAAVSAGLNGAGMWLLSKQLGVHYLLAQLACTGFVLLIGYVLNRAWTFKPSAELAQPGEPVGRTTLEPAEPRPLPANS